MFLFEVYIFTVISESPAYLKISEIIYSDKLKPRLRPNKELVRTQSRIFQKVRYILIEHTRFVFRNEKISCRKSNPKEIEQFKSQKLGVFQSVITFYG